MGPQDLRQGVIFKDNPNIFGIVLRHLRTNTFIRIFDIIGTFGSELFGRDMPPEAWLTMLNIPKCIEIKFPTYHF